MWLMIILSYKKAGFHPLSLSLCLSISLSLYLSISLSLENTLSEKLQGGEIPLPSPFQPI